MKVEWIALSLIGLMCAGVGTSFAEDDVPTHAVDGNYIKEWLVIGPFPKELDTDFLEAYGGEPNIHPKEGDTITMPEEKTLTWKRSVSDGKSVNLLVAVGNYEHVTAYAYCEIVNPKAQEVEMLVGNDDGVKIWINGKESHRSIGGRALILDIDTVAVHLSKGMNQCLVKVSNGIGDWGFSIRTQNYEGLV